MGNISEVTQRLLDAGVPAAQLLMELEEEVQRIMQIVIKDDPSNAIASPKLQRLLDALENNPVWMAVLKSSIKGNKIKLVHGQAYFNGFVCGVGELLFNQKFRLLILKTMLELDKKTAAARGNDCG